MCPRITVSMYLKDCRGCVDITCFQCMSQKRRKQNQINKVKAAKSFEEWSAQLPTANINQWSWCLLQGEWRCDQKSSKALDEGEEKEEDCLQDKWRSSRKNDKAAAPQEGQNEQVKSVIQAEAGTQTEQDFVGLVESEKEQEAMAAKVFLFGWWKWRIWQWSRW